MNAKSFEYNKLLIIKNEYQNNIFKRNKRTLIISYNRSFLNREYI